MCLCLLLEQANCPSHGRAHYTLWLSKKIFICSWFPQLRFGSIQGETNTTKGQTNPLKEEKPLKSAAKLSNSLLYSLLQKDFWTCCQCRAFKRGCQGFTLFICEPSMHQLSTTVMEMRGAATDALSRAWPPWAVSHHHTLLPPHPVGLLVWASPSPNQVLLGLPQWFCFRGAGTGSKASNCKWVDTFPDPSPSLT